MRKILPMKNPVNTTWTWNADTDAVIRNSPSSIEWIYSNYVQLYCFSDKSKNDEIFIDFQLGCFEDCPYLKTQTITRDFISIFTNDIIDFFIKCINSENYIFAFVDESVFINGRNNKYCHEIFIFGYDTDSREFDVADFTFSVGYSFSKVSFDDVEKSYYNINKSDSVYCNPLKIASINNQANYKFDKTLFKQSLQCYVNSCFTYEYNRISSNRNDNISYTYGLSVYDCIIDHLLYCKNMKVKIDIRPLHLEYIHKVIMKDRFNYLVEKKILDNETDICTSIDIICKKLLEVRNLCIKYNITFNHEQICKIQLKISEIKENEQKLLQHVLKII